MQDEVPAIKDEVTCSWQMATMWGTGPLTPSPWIPSAWLVSPRPAVFSIQRHLLSVVHVILEECFRVIKVKVIYS